MAKLLACLLPCLLLTTVMCFLDGSDQQSAAAVTYILCEFFSKSFVINFVVVVTLLACDFWVVMPFV